MLEYSSSFLYTEYFEVLLHVEWLAGLHVHGEGAGVQGQLVVERPGHGAGGELYPVLGAGELLARPGDAGAAQYSRERW